MDDIDNLSLEDGTCKQLKQRCLWPGAATSDADFSKLFHLSTVPTVSSKSRRWNLWTRQIQFCTRSSYGQTESERTARLPGPAADIFLREHAFIYWIAEGGTTLRFHAGDCYMKTPTTASREFDPSFTFKPFSRRKHCFPLRTFRECVVIILCACKIPFQRSVCIVLGHNECYHYFQAEHDMIHATRNRPKSSPPRPSPS